MKNRNESQQLPIFIAGQTFANKEGQYPGISIMTAAQVSEFITGENFTDKACVSLNEIFCPYDRKNTHNLPYAEDSTNTGFGYIPTAGETTPTQAEYQPYRYPINARGIGIRSNITMVGPDTYASGYVEDTIQMDGTDLGSGGIESIKNWKAGELDITWSPNRKKWTGADFVTGYLTSNLNGSGSFTISGVTIGGIEMPERLECYNFDNNVDVTATQSQPVAIVAVRIGSKHIPIYIGCEL